MDFETRLRSRAMRIIASQRFMAIKQSRARLLRRIKGEEQVVHYFHQVDDPYSHLAVQKLGALIAAYNIRFVPHLVSAPGADFMGDEQRYGEWAKRDAHSIAEFYNTTLPENIAEFDSQHVSRANVILAEALSTEEFAKVAYETGESLWQGIDPGHGNMRLDVDSIVAAGNRLRTKLGHYFGAMFYFEGEWFWGVDRLHLLEKRLRAEGHQRFQDTSLCVPEPRAEVASDFKASTITLEYFPSLRSPYTAVGHDRVADLIKRSGVTLALKPVMPMMMRGVSAPRSKQQYIMTDAAREARAHHVRFGNFVDPFGEPVKLAFSFFPAALRLGRGIEYVGTYLKAAWAEGINITSEKGMEKVASNAGLDWAVLKQEAAGENWMQVLDDNLDDMLNAGLWGVPSFRVSGGNEPAFACWGQDRIWRVETEITRRMKNIK